jgi:hypothetical protein
MYYQEELNLPLGLALFVLAESDRDGLSERLDEILKLLLGGLDINVLDEEIGELSSLLLDLGLSLLLSDVVSDIDLFVVEQHAVDSLDGSSGSFTSGVVDKGESSGLATLVETDFAREDLTESGKGVVESLVVDRFVKVLDKDVSLTSLSQSRVSLRPHDSAGLVLDQRVVEVIEGLFSVVRVHEVDVGVSEGSSGNGVSADSDAVLLALLSIRSRERTYEATGPIMLKISNNMASVTALSSSPT